MPSSPETLMAGALPREMPVRPAPKAAGAGQAARLAQLLSAPAFLLLIATVIAPLVVVFAISLTDYRLGRLSLNMIGLAIISGWRRSVLLGGAAQQRGLYGHRPFPSRCSGRSGWPFFSMAGGGRAGSMRSSISCRSPPR